MVEAKKTPKKAAVKSRVSKAPLSHGVGRRKAAIARVWVRPGKGALIVNGKDMQNYFDTEPARLSASMPYKIYPAAMRYDISADVHGGGIEAQADAVQLGIARALSLLSVDDARPLFRSAGLLTVDSRVKERKKYGQKAARAKFQFVKR